MESKTPNDAKNAASALGQGIANLMKQKNLQLASNSSQRGTSVVEGEPSPTQKQTTPASILVKRAGGDKPSKKSEDYALNQFKIQMEDIDQSGYELAEKIISFDVQNYIKQQVEERTQPVIEKSMKFLNNLHELQKKFAEHRHDYSEFKNITNNKIANAVTFQTYTEGMKNLDQKIMSETLHLNEEVIELKGRMEEVDHALELNERNHKVIENQFSGIKANLTGTVRYVNETATRVEDTCMKLRNDTELMLNSFERDLKSMMQLQDEDRISLQLNTDKIVNLSKSFEKFQMTTDAKIGKIKQDHIKKLISVQKIAEINLLRTAEKLTSEFHYLNKRLRHKILYQIGLTDDPWQDKRDFIMDDVYSQNLDDPDDVLKVKRSNSYDRFTGYGRRYDVNRNQLIELEPKDVRKQKSKPRKPGTARDTSSLRNKMYNVQRKYKNDKGPHKLNTGQQSESDGFWDENIAQQKDEYDERKPNFVKKPQIVKGTGVKKIDSSMDAKGGPGAPKKQIYDLQQFQKQTGDKTNKGPFKLVYVDGIDPKTKWREEQESYLRASNKLTFRAQAMRLLEHKKRDFLFEMDQQDRFMRERRGKKERDWQVVNPHRVQMFSLNEVWKCVQQRLVELNVMKDPDEVQQDSEPESEELEEDFDFIAAAKERAGQLFTGKRRKDAIEKPLADIMKQRDFLLINECLLKCAEHEEKLNQNREEIDEHEKELKRIRKFRVEYEEFRAKYEEDQKQIKETQKRANKKFHEFTTDYFPKFMEDQKEATTLEVLKRVHGIEAMVVTVDMLVEELKKEREGPVQENIDKLGKDLEQQIQKQEYTLTKAFEPKLNKLQDQIVETNVTIDKVNTEVVKHEEKFQQEQEMQVPMTDDELEAKGITKKYGLLWDKDGRPYPLSKIDIVNALGEANKMRFLLEDQVLSLAETTASQSDQIKAINKKFARGKNDALIVAEQNKVDLQREFSYLRQDVEEVLTQVTMKEMERDSLFGGADSSAFNTKNAFNLKPKGQTKINVQPPELQQSAQATKKKNQKRTVGDSPNVNHGDDFSLTTNSFHQNARNTFRQNNDYDDDGGFYKPQKARDVSLTVKKGTTDPSVGSVNAFDNGKRKSVMSKLSNIGNEESGTGTQRMSSRKAKETLADKFQLPNLNNPSMRHTLQVSGKFKRGLGRSSLAEINNDSPQQKMLAGYSNARYGSQELNIAALNTINDRNLKEETSGILPNRNVKMTISGINTNRVQGRNGDKMIHQSGKDFIRVNARKNQEIFNTERKKPHQAKYASALGHYKNQSKAANGTVDLTNNMDKMSHFELSPRNIVGPQSILTTEIHGSGKSLERMTDLLIKAEGSKDHLTQDSIFSSSKNFMPETQNKLVGSFYKQQAKQIQEMSKVQSKPKRVFQSVALKPGSLTKPTDVQVNVTTSQPDAKKNMISKKASTMTIGDEDLEINPIMDAKISSKKPNFVIGGQSPPKYLGNQLQYKQEEEQTLNKVRADRDALQLKREQRIQNLVETMGTANPKPHQIPHPVSNVRDMGIQIRTNNEGDYDNSFQTDQVQTMKHANNNNNLYTENAETANFPSVKNQSGVSLVRPDIQVGDIDQDQGERPLSSDQMTAMGLQPSLSPFRTSGTKDNVWSIHKPSVSNLKK